VANHLSKGFRVNNLYDIDPSVASAAIPGFTEWMNFYSNYRVIRARCKYTWVSRESAITGALTCVCWSNQTVSANALNLPYYGNPNMPVRIVAAASSTPGAQNMINQVKRMDEISGDIQCYTESGYTGSSGSGPVTNLNCIVGVTLEAQGTTMTLGLAVRIEFELDSILSDRKLLNT